MVKVHLSTLQVQHTGNTMERTILKVTREDKEGEEYTIQILGNSAPIVTT